MTLRSVCGNSPTQTVHVLGANRGLAVYDCLFTVACLTMYNATLYFSANILVMIKFSAVAL